MIRRPATRRKKRRGLGAALTPRGRAVVRAFRAARQFAPGFIVSCGVLPEVSESASERMHDIVRQVAEQNLGGRRHLHLFRQRSHRARNAVQASDSLERDLTAFIEAESTAAYLFGLAVGLAVHALPERLTRNGRQR